MVTGMSHKLLVTNGPAVYHDGFVAGSNLDFSDFKDDVNHSLDPRAATVRGPVGDVELTQLLNLFRL